MNASDELLREISQKLSVLIALAIKNDGGGVQGYVEQLSRFGLSTSQIAEILNSTAGTISVAKSRLKKKASR